MCAKWNQAYNPELLANGLENIRTRKPSGEHQGFDAHRYDDYVTVMHSSLDFSAAIPEVERRNIIWKAITSVARRGKLSVQAILSEVSKQEGAFEKLPKKKFVLATSLSVRHFGELKRTAILGSQITFSKRLPKHFNQQSIIGDARRVVCGNLPEDYVSVRISVEARSVHEATECALDGLDLLRGIWNLAFQRQKAFWFPMEL